MAGAAEAMVAVAAGLDFGVGDHWDLLGKLRVVGKLTVAIGQRERCWPPQWFEVFVVVCLGWRRWGLLLVRFSPAPVRAFQPRTSS